MNVKKSFRFQLAPLVDLLLIVVFAQFLDIRETSSREDARVTRELVEAREETARLNQQIDRARDEAERLRTRQKDLARRSGQAIAAITEAFDIDAATPGEMESWVGDQNESRSERVRQIADRVAQASPEEVIRFLIGHAELLKRAEIWHLHADADRRILLSADQRDLVMRLERDGQDSRTTELQDKLFAAYKQLPQPKGLVVILVSYSPDSIAGIYQPLLDAMPRAVERMRNDLPLTRFEYTTLGATPLPDVLETSSPEPLEIEP